MPKLGAHVEALEALLAANERKPRRERLTLVRLYEELRATTDYAGGYDAVRRHARRWQREEAGRTAPVFVPLAFDPGEAYQFDWSHETVVLAGVTTKVKVAHLRLCHSRMFIVGPIRARARRWCSTPISEASPSWVAHACVAFTTT